MRCDYHVHCYVSSDSKETLAAYAQRMRAAGLDEFCITDHFEYDYPGEDYSVPVLNDRLAVYESAGFAFKFGVEAGMNRLDDANRRLSEAIKSAPWLDFVIASTHVVDGADPYFPQFFEGRTRAEAFSRYLQEIYENIRAFTEFNVVGHIDYPSKGCPFDDKMLRISDAPDVLDELFRLVIARGQGIELNTSIYTKLGGPVMDIAWLKRYRELGGEVLTVGSDAHKAERLGNGVDDALEFAREAGLRYVCTFEKRAPVFHKI